MVEGIKKYCPEDTTFVTPKGGFFLWARIPDSIDIDKLFDNCSERGVVFVKGIAFDFESLRNNLLLKSFT